MNQRYVLFAGALLLTSCGTDLPVQRSGLGSGCVGKSNSSPVCQAGILSQQNQDLPPEETVGGPARPKFGAQLPPASEEVVRRPSQPESVPEVETPSSRPSPSGGLFGEGLTKTVENIFGRIFNSDSGGGSAGRSSGDENPAPVNPSPRTPATSPSSPVTSPASPSTPVVSPSVPVQMPVSITVTNRHTSLSYLKANSTVDVTAALAAGRTPATQYCSISPSASFTVRCIEGISNSSYFKVTGPSVAGCPSTGWLYKSHFTITSGASSGSCP
ncbi:MAG: hypothetical protein EBR09_09190 [Proteobacteria bacterium]|nr:hypothetical protein [Pseudomonadota bacterium]